MAIVDIHGNSDPDDPATATGSTSTGMPARLLLDGVTVHSDAAEHSCNDATEPDIDGDGILDPAEDLDGNGTFNIPNSTVIGFCQNYNNYIWIEHPNGEWSKYTHMQTGSITGAPGNLSVGDTVLVGADARHRGRHRIGDRPPSAPRGGRPHRRDRRHAVLGALHRPLDPRRRRRGPDEHRVLRRRIHRGNEPCPVRLRHPGQPYADSTTSPATTPSREPVHQHCADGVGRGALLRRRGLDRAARRHGQQRSRERDPDATPGRRRPTSTTRPSRLPRTPRSTTRSTTSTSP